MCNKISFFVKCHSLVIFHVICIKWPINQMKTYLECNQKSMNCSSTSILYRQLFKKYENLKWDIVTWKYGWNMAFPFPITPKLFTVLIDWFFISGFQRSMAYQAGLLKVHIQYTGFNSQGIHIHLHELLQLKKERKLKNGEKRLCESN